MIGLPWALRAVAGCILVGALAAAPSTLRAQYSSNFWAEHEGYRPGSSSYYGGYGGYAGYGGYGSQLGVGSTRIFYGVPSTGLSLGMPAYGWYRGMGYDGLGLGYSGLGLGASNSSLSYRNLGYGGLGYGGLNYNGLGYGYGGLGHGGLGYGGMTYGLGGSVYGSYPPASQVYGSTTPYSYIVPYGSTYQVAPYGSAQPYSYVLPPSPQPSRSIQVAPNRNTQSQAANNRQPYQAQSSTQPQRFAPVPNDLRPGMVLPDGAIVTSVGPLQPVNQ